MTNTLAAIVITLAASITSQVETNISETMEQSAGVYLASWPGQYVPPPKAKIVTTKIELVKRLAFDWEGLKRTVEAREVISEKSQRYVARDEWVKDGEAQNVERWRWRATYQTNGIAISTNVWLLGATNIMEAK